MDAAHRELTDAEPDDETGEEAALVVGTEASGERLDKFLAAALPDLSRSYIQQLIAGGQVLVDGQARRPAFKVTAGETVTVVVPPPESVVLAPEPIPLDVVYEDADVLVINKPAGLVVHPAPGHASGTLVNAVLAHAPEISIGGSNRPGIVHRLDKDTSGLMVVAKSDRAYNALVGQWQARTVEKGYSALVHGAVEPEAGTVEAPVGRDQIHRQRMAVTPKGRPAVTNFTVRERLPQATLLDVAPETGRTHQIRVHLAFIGHPIVGDTVYGRARAGTPHLERQFLHAARLGFRLPNGRAVNFEAPLPPDLAAYLGRLRPAEQPDER